VSYHNRYFKITKDFITSDSNKFSLTGICKWVEIIQVMCMEITDSDGNKISFHTK